ncbi:MAG: hydroxymethylglutaryl-CoA lyase [Acidimicrobiales bacterium]
MPRPLELPGRVDIVEVGPRDGLQNESAVLDTEAKLSFIARAVAAGARRIEVASFVNPQRVPQMADAEAVVAGLPAADDVTYVGLVLNRRGMERAIESGLREVNAVVVGTDGFGTRNQGQTIEASLVGFAELARMAADAGMTISATVSVAFGCPYEGEVPVERVADVAGRAAAAGAQEIALGDTIGVATPGDVAARIDAAREAVDGIPLRVHFHNTRNTGIANAYAAVEAGVTVLDASIGGIGGCPFAPKATGNIPTEDLVYMLDRMGIATGFDLDGLIDIVPWVEDRLGRAAPGLLARAGRFPGPPR